MATKLRVALIGKTGAGKSSLGNTLIGRYGFHTSFGGCSETTVCAKQLGELPSGAEITVVDTPGLIDTKNIDVKPEVTKAISFLTPGPHAFIIVLQPTRATPEEKRVLDELQNLFGTESFLDKTLLVMVRRNDLKHPVTGDIVNIHDYMQQYAAEEIKTIYEKCGKRIVAVENVPGLPDEDDNKRELTKYATELESAIRSMGDDYFSHQYFVAVQEIQELRKNEQELEAELKSLREAKSRELQTKSQELQAKDDEIEQLKKMSITDRAGLEKRIEEVERKVTEEQIKTFKIMQDKIEELGGRQRCSIQ